MDKPKTIVVTIKGMISDPELAQLKRFSKVTYVEKESVTQDELASMVNGYDYLMLNYDVVKKLDSSFYSKPSVKSLKGISTDITGMEWANPSISKEQGILLMNTPGYSTESVAESILLEALLHTRKIHEAYKDVIKGQEPKERKGINLEGRTVGIVGLGSIGMRLTELFKGVGANVIAWNRTPKVVKKVTMMQLKELFEKSDVVCLALKTVKGGSETTEGIINSELLKSAKKGQILINLAGRALVDHDALYEQLSTGNISGYSVTRSRDASIANHKITSLDCVHMPPANAWLSDESLNNLKKIWMGNVISAIKGTPTNIVKD